MTKSKAVRQYVRKVSRKLTCYKLTQELSAYSALSYEELYEKLGLPIQTAAQLIAAQIPSVSVLFRIKCAISIKCIAMVNTNNRG